MSNNTIYSKTNDYIQALSDTDEVKVYKKAAEEFENDSEAKKLLSDFQEAQRTYAVLREGKFDGVKEQEKKVRDLNNELLKNKKIQSLVKSQKILQTFIGDIVGHISQGINFSFAKQEQGGCCG